MPQNIEGTTYYTISESGKLFKKLCGHKYSNPLIYRWIKKGCKGVQLEAIQRPRQMVLTEQSIRDFLDQIAPLAIKRADNNDTVPGISRKKKTRQTLKRHGI